MHAEQAAARQAADGARRSRTGKRVVRDRFGVDPDTCTGDHSCIRLSGCPSLTIAPQPGSAAEGAGDEGDQLLRRLRRCAARSRHAAVLCPSFYRASIINNPTRVGSVQGARRATAVIGCAAAAARTQPPARKRHEAMTAPDRAAEALANPPDHDRDPRHGRRGRRRAGRLDRRSGRAGGYIAQMTSVPASPSAPARRSTTSNCSRRPQPKRRGRRRCWR